MDDRFKKRAGELGNPPVFTDHRAMLAATKPDFVIALGQHSRPILRELGYTEAELDRLATDKAI